MIFRIKCQLRLFKSKLEADMQKKALVLQSRKDEIFNILSNGVQSLSNLTNFFSFGL